MPTFFAVRSRTCARPGIQKSCYALLVQPLNRRRGWPRLERATDNCKYAEKMNTGFASIFTLMLDATMWRMTVTRYCDGRVYDSTASPYWACHCTLSPCHVQGTPYRIVSAVPPCSSVYLQCRSHVLCTAVAQTLCNTFRDVCTVLSLSVQWLCIASVPCPCCVILHSCAGPLRCAFCSAGLSCCA